MIEEKSHLTMHPKVEAMAAAALGFFQKGDISSGTGRLSKAYALSRKTTPTSSPILPLVGYLGLLNDSDSPQPRPADPRSTSRLVGRHHGICGVIEEWSFERAMGKKDISTEFHAAASRFCLDSSLSEEMRGVQDQIGIPAQILNEFGVDVSTPQKTMEAVEKYLSVVGEMAPEQKDQAGQSQNRPAPTREYSAPQKISPTPRSTSADRI